MKSDKGSLPDGWAKASIDDVTVNKIPQVVPDKKLDFIYIDISSIDNNIKEIISPKKLHGEQAPSRARQLITVNDVLVSMTRPNLNAVALVPDLYSKAIASTGFDVLRSIEVEPKWLFLNVRSKEFVREMSTLVQGALYPAVKSKDVRDYRISVPPLNEQKRIVAKIEELQARSRRAREALETVPDLLKQLRQSILAAAFRGDLTRQWRKKNNMHDDEVHFVNMREPFIHKVKGPKLWRLLKIKDVCRIVGGSQPPKAFFENEPTNENIRLIQIRDYKTDDFKVYIPMEKAKRFCRPDDIMIGRYGPPIFQILKGLNGAYNVALMKAVPNDDVVHKEFLRWYLQSPLLYRYIEADSLRTAGQSGVRKSHLYEYPIFVPDKEEQLQIVNILIKKLSFISMCSQLISDTTDKICFLDESVFSKAFRGELVPQDPNDEPASILLERILQEKARLVAEQKTKPSQRGKKMKGPKIKQKNILTILQESASAMTPEELFAACGFGEDYVDAFYEQLRSAVIAKKVRETRKGADVRLEAAP